MGPSTIRIPLSDFKQYKTVSLWAYVYRVKQLNLHIYKVTDFTIRLQTGNESPFRRGFRHFLYQASKTVDSCKQGFSRTSLGIVLAKIDHGAKMT